MTDDTKTELPPVPPSPQFVFDARAWAWKELQGWQTDGKSWNYDKRLQMAHHLASWLMGADLVTESETKS